MFQALNGHLMVDLQQRNTVMVDSVKVVLCGVKNEMLANKMAKILKM
jgi:hypothetical protein